jgi:hypothetical protein
VPRTGSGNEVKRARDLSVGSSDFTFALSVSKLHFDVFGGKTYACNGQIDAVCECLGLDLRFCVNIEVVTVEIRADTSDAIDADNDLGFLCVRVKELEGNWLKHEVLPVLTEG